MMTKTTIDYPIIKFDVKVNHIAKIKTEGYAIKDWLCVGWSDNRRENISIFNCFGYRVTTFRFVTWSDAVRMADWLDTIYGDYYFHLWEDDPKANIPLLTQHSIPNGTILYNILQLKHENQIVEFDDIVREYEQLRHNT